MAGCTGRPLDHAAHYGGEEFAVILADATPQAAHALATALRDAVTGLAMPHAGSPFGPVTRIGLRTIVPSRSAFPEHVPDQADAALDATKRAGRNRVAGHDGYNPVLLAESAVAVFLAQRFR